MNQILHQELLTLQRNLADIQSAKIQVETVKTAAQKVVESVQFIQQQYETHLPDLLQKLRQSNEQQFANLQAENSQIILATVENLTNTNTQISTKYSLQYEQIQSYLVQYESVIKLISELERTISQVDFPERLEKLENVISNIHTEIKQDIVELKEVKATHEAHLAAIQEAHQYYLTNFYQNTEQKFSTITSNYDLQTKAVIQDFKILEQETEVIFNQQKQNFHITLQQIALQTNKTLDGIVQTFDKLLTQIAGIISQMHQDFNIQQADLQAFVASYQGLVTYTQAIENRITDINFPQKLFVIASQLTTLESKTEDNHTELKNITLKQFSDVETRLTMNKKQQDTQHQLLENQNLLLQNQQEQIQRHLQHQMNDLHKIQVQELKTQTDFLQKQLSIQDKMLQYLLIAIVSLGIFSIIQLVWLVFKS